MKRKHIATGQPKGRPRLDLDRLVHCWCCQKEYPLSQLSNSRLCSICCETRMYQASEQMHLKRGFFYQRWLAATAKGRIAQGQGK